jgi:hypothetical protein
LNTSNFFIKMFVCFRWWTSNNYTSNFFNRNVRFSRWWNSNNLNTNFLIELFVF